MHTKNRRRIAFGATAAAAAALAGGAYAATQSSTPSPRDALINDVANRLHVSPAQLRSALRGAVIDQLQAAVKSGRLTQAQASAIEQRIRQGGPGFPEPWGPPGGLSPHFGHRGALGSAATYLGLSDSQLVAQLSAGKTLAQVAQAHGKSVDGLRQALIADERTQIERAVRDGVLPKNLAEQLQANISSRVGALLNRTWPRLMGFREGRAHGGFFGPGGWSGGDGAPGQTAGPGPLPGLLGSPPPGAPNGPPPTT